MDSTRRLVAKMKACRRRSLLGSGALLAAILTGFMAVCTLADEALGEIGPLPAAHEMVVPDDVDVVAYRLPRPHSLTTLAWELWQDEVSAREVLYYNPGLDVQTTLPAGTVVQVPNFRGFPVEELATQ